MNTCKGCVYQEREGCCTYGGMCFDPDGNRTRYMPREQDDPKWWEHFRFQSLVMRALNKQKRITNMGKKEYCVTKPDYLCFGLKYRYGRNGIWHDVGKTFKSMEEVNDYINKHQD